MAKFKPLTPEQAAKFQEMWSDPAVPVNEICRQFGITRSTVHYWVVNRFALPARPKSRWDFVPRNPVFEVRDAEPAGAYDNPRPATVQDGLPATRLHGLPARLRPGDRPDECWIQLI